MTTFDQPHTLESWRGRLPPRTSVAAVIPSSSRSRPAPSIAGSYRAMGVADFVAIPRRRPFRQHDRSLRPHWWWGVHSCQCHPCRDRRRNGCCREVYWASCRPFGSPACPDSVPCPEIVRWVADEWFCRKPSVVGSPCILYDCPFCGRDWMGRETMAIVRIRKGMWESQTICLPSHILLPWVVGLPTIVQERITISRNLVADLGSARLALGETPHCPQFLARWFIAIDDRSFWHYNLAISFAIFTSWF